NEVCRDLIRSGKVEYERPGITELEGQLWKGKADIVNHDEKLIIDLKTTADITKFKYSASKYNYDSQAYIYSKLFGYEMLFIAIDKNTHQIGIFDCSPEFYARGKDKVERAVQAYELFYKSEDFDPKQYFLTKTL
ncbi:PD-(D/E)XK nuclease-like domain-containing protein, partial [bacterium]|nr:PD-(D/E)XK nuclease-like domain-containing protein [bacterium]